MIKVSISFIQTKATLEITCMDQIWVPSAKGK